jgi:hypothetical protein
MLVAAVAFWFSYPAMFVFGGLSLALLAELWHEGVRARSRYLLINLPAVVSFVVLWLFPIRGQRDEFLVHYWRQYFPDYSHPLRATMWLPQRLWEMFCYIHQPMGGLLLPVAFIGAIWLYKTRRAPLVLALAGPIALAVFAAATLQYPFGPKRVTFYLIPSELLLAAAGLEAIRQQARYFGRLLWWVPAALAVANGLVHQSIMFAHPRPQSHLRPAVAYLRQHRKASEPIYVIGRGTTTFLVNWPEADARIHLDYDIARPIGDAAFWAIQGFDEKSTPAALRASDGTQASPDPNQTLQTPGSLVAFYHKSSGADHP